MLMQQSPPVVWDAFKAVARGECILAIKTARINENEEYKNLQQEEREQARAHADSPSRVSYESLLEVRRCLSLLVKGQTKSEESQKMHKIFAEGDKNGKLLAMLVVDHPPMAHIPVIKDGAGRMVSDPALMQEFVDFFLSLYSPIPPYDTAELDNVLQSLPIPRLSEEDCILLEAKITVKEIEAAICAFPPNKAPGPDGIPADFYKVNVE